MVTIQDIARKAEVSSATVSRVLNNKSATIPISARTREKVLAIAKELEYRPNPFAKSLRTNRTQNVGVIIWDLTDSFFSAILKGIEQVLVKSGYNLLLSNADSSGDNELACLERLRGLWVEGLLIVGGIDCFSSTKIEKLGIDPTTLVLIGARTTNELVNSVSVDNIKGGFMGAEYLIQQDRQAFAYIAGEHKTSDVQDRLAGVQKAMTAYQVEKQFRIYEEGPGEAEGYRVARDFLQKARLPAAIFGMNDKTCLGAIRACRDLDLNIPRDVAILGYDNFAFADYVVPRLSSIRQHRLTLGRLGTEMLLEKIKKKNAGQTNKPCHTVLTPDLFLRESS